MNSKLYKILLHMSRLGVYVLIATQSLTMVMAGGTNAQKKLDEIVITLELSQRSESLIEVLKRIESNSSFSFAYSKGEIKKKEVILESRSWNMDHLLKSISSQAQVSFKRVNNHIGVRVPETLESFPQIVDEIKVLRQVEGVVTDDTNEALPGATILERGTTNGTVTDVDGMFSMEVQDGAVLEVSFIGFLTQEVVVGKQTKIMIELEPDMTSLEEVVVVGYGSQKRSDITGAVVSVPQDRLENLPVTNVLHALQGTTAGLQITQTSSVPGSSASIQVRGINSINANNSPLIVLDGVPFFGVTNDINPNDIKSIEVLKDASAVAIYGTRGSNGVILITTKRGKVSDKPTIKYSGYVAIDKISNPLTPMGPDAYVQKYADFMEQNNRPQTAVLPNSSEVDNYNEGITTDWLDEASRTGKIQEHSISISSGTEKFQYYFSGSRLIQEGVVEGYQFQKTNFRVNLDAEINEYLKIGTSAFFTENNYDGGRANLLNATAMSPYSVPEDENGDYIIFPMAPELLFANPLLGLTRDRLSRGKNLTGTGYAEISPLEGLSYRLNGSYSFNIGRSSNYSGRQANDNNGTANIENTETANWVVENILKYSKDFDKHHIDITTLYSAQQVDYFKSELRAIGFVNDGLSYNDTGAGATQTNNSESNSYTLLSQMGRINYGYDSRYLLTLTARRDGYSAFGANTSKYGVFPSVAVAWNISNEAFMASVNSVSNLKFRLSHGQTGNQAITVNQTANTGTTVSTPFDGSALVGVVFEALQGNADLTWETTTSSNIGVDYAFLKNRVKGSVEYYRSKTEDILLRRSIPRTTGYEEVWTNLGVMRNRGFEFSISSVNVNKRDFSWETNINFATYKNELVELYGDGEDDIGNRWFIGESVNVAFDYEKVGIWQEGEEDLIAATDPVSRPGDIRFKDQNGDGQINSEDRVVLDQRDPRWTGGITNTFTYKNFTLSVFVQTAQGGLKSNRDLTYADEAGRRNLPEGFGYWTPENRDNYWPSLAAFTNNRGYGFLEDPSYVRIKDVRLSYRFSEEVLGKYLQGLTIYASGRNLHTFTNWFGWDPENNYSSRGSEGWESNYPLVRTISFGINATL